ncbi:MAG: prepilin-type N-terminal cleavage/methylation domain-containing protein [Candidatus Nomurabacteria bacterium]|nr:prepilin-type N-terminal cleavage/methylation domain-containing protein [Candidatus Nomurabacteria bacterium]
MQNKNNNNRKRGFTIIETMISVSLFLIIVMVGMGALLNADMLHNKSKSMRSIMDNLSFIMEDMSRNIRTGYNYRCYESGTWPGISQQSVFNTPQSCISGGVLVFEEAHGKNLLTTPPDTNATDQWIYKIESTDGGLTFDISKSVDGGVTWVQMNSDEVSLNGVSGFSVIGAEAGDNQQPFVTIKLVGNINLQNNIQTPFSLQTSVSQRQIDR